MTHSFDAGEVRRAVQEDARRHEHLYQQISREIGPFDYVSMTTPEMARYALTKLNLTVPSDDETKVVALENYIAGRAHRETGGPSMDSADSFVDQYIRGGDQKQATSASGGGSAMDSGRGSGTSSFSRRDPLNFGNGCT